MIPFYDVARGVSRVLTYPLVLAAARWLAVFAVLYAARDREPPWLAPSLLVYAALATLLSVPGRHPGRGVERREEGSRPVLLMLAGLDVAATAAVALVAGPNVFGVLAGLAAATLAAGPALVVLAACTLATAFGSSVGQDVSPLEPGIVGLALSLSACLAATYGLLGRHRAELQIRAITRVLDAGSNLGTKFSLPDVLSQLINLLTQFKESVPWQNAVIFMTRYDEEWKEDVLVPEAIAGPHAEFYRSRRLRFGEGVVGYTAMEQRPQAIADLQKDYRDSGVPKPKTVRGALVVPITSEGHAIGCVLLTSTLPNAYEFEHQRVIDRLVRVASVGIQNARLHSKTMELAETDSMTGLLTNRAFHERLEQEFKRAQITRQSLSLLIADVDFFKRINDTYGHPQGDELLRQIGQIIRRYARKGDICCRYGGDEFTVVMPHTVKAEAVMVAERLREAVEEESFQLDATIARITISIGVAGYPQDCTSKQVLVKSSDAAMYVAKQSGRNNVKVAGHRETAVTKK